MQRLNKGPGCSVPGDRNKVVLNTVNKSFLRTTAMVELHKSLRRSKIKDKKK